jgi:subtilisin family serine protease
LCCITLLLLLLLAGTRILSYMPAYKCKDGSASCISGTPNLGYLSGTSMAAPIVSGQVAMCYERGVCKSHSGSEYSKIVRPAGSYSRSNKRFGFNGDPYNAPVTGKYYGFLIYGNTY